MPHPTPLTRVSRNAGTTTRAVKLTALLLARPVGGSIARSACPDRPGPQARMAVAILLRDQGAVQRAPLRDRRSYLLAEVGGDVVPVFEQVHDLLQLAQDRHLLGESLFALRD